MVDSLLVRPGAKVDCFAVDYCSDYIGWVDVNLAFLFFRRTHQQVEVDRIL